MRILINEDKQPRNKIREAGVVAKEKKPRLTKEGLDARFAARQDANRARRETKVTREDVERHLNERKSKRVDKKSAGQLGRTVSLGLGIAFLVGSGVLATTVTASSRAFEVTSQLNEEKIAAAEGTLAEIPAADGQSAGDYASELEGQIADARAKGEEVATLQQEFTTILSRGDTETSSNGAPSTAVKEWAEHRKLLAPYFVERALLVKDSSAYAPGSVFPFSDDEIDPRFPWYQTATPDPAASSWELVSMVATSTPQVLEATWLNKSPVTGDLFAWATASYYVDAGGFGSLTTGVTTLGEQGTPAAATNTDGE